MPTAERVKAIHGRTPNGRGKVLVRTPSYHSLSNALFVCRNLNMNAGGKVYKVIVRGGQYFGERIVKP